MTMAPPSRPANGARPTNLPAKPVNRLARVDLGSIVAPPRLVVNAVEGWGKTSLAAFAPNAAILMARGESGYITLLKAGLVPSIPAATLDSWSDTLSQVEAMATDPQGVELLALDALGGFERMCHEHVCARDFNGEWGDKGFGSFQKGFEVSVAEWLKLLQLLDRLRSKGVAVVILAHAKVKPFKNPLGADFDKYIVDCHDKTLAATARWADAILFGTFKTVTVDAKGSLKTDNAKGRTKGIGGDERVLYTQQRDAYTAKNRYGMPAEIVMPTTPGEMWGLVQSYLDGKAGADAPATEDGPPE